MGVTRHLDLFLKDQVLPRFVVQGDAIARRRVGAGMIEVVAVLRSAVVDQYPIGMELLDQPSRFSTSK
jgi:hypothetical protein